MERSELLKRIAPCALMCHTCTGYYNGIICESAKTLLNYLDGIKEFYEKHLPDAVESYSNFEEEVYKQWLEGNQQIRNDGIEAYWENNSENPHYKPYKK